MPDEVKLRCLNEDGVREFEAWIQELRAKPDEPAPYRLLADDAYSHEFQLGDVVLERRRFASRGDFARYLNQRFEAARIFHDVDVDGMWEWLSLFYLDDTCPVQADGTRRVYRSERHVLRPETDYRRHLLRNAYMIFRQVGLADPEAADLLMSQPVDRYAHVITQIGERPTILRSSGALHAARELFYDPDSNSTRPRVQDPERGARRFARTVVALSKTTDLQGINATTVLAMLPEEFDTWIEDAARRSEIAQLRSDLDAGGFLGKTGGPATSRAQRIARMHQSLTQQSQRRTATVSRLVRHDMFRMAVLEAYDSRCAVSGIGFVFEPSSSAPRYEVEAAHIKPVAKGGDDMIYNGIALTRTLHWAFDNGMFAIDPDFLIQVMPHAKANPRNRLLACFDGRKLRLPQDRDLAPATDALRWHAQNIATPTP